MLERTETPSVNYPQKALTKLKNYGLAQAHLIGCDWFNSDTHVLGLSYLMTAKHSPASVAINELKDLHPDQIEGLMKGLDKKDLFDLKKYQIKAFHHLSSWGVKSSLIRNCKWFNTNTHFNVLKKLICVDLISAEKALTDMSDLNQEQMHALIANDFSIEEIQGLNKWQLLALCQLKEYGITHEHLRTKNWFTNEIHFQTLSALITTLKMSAEDALAEMENLTPEQTVAIRNGHSRNDVLTLTPFQLQVITHPDLCTNTNTQVMPHHLIGKKWFNSKGHVDALITLIRSHNHTVDSALVELDDTTETQAICIELGVPREDVIHLQDNQLEAYRLLHSYGLKLNQLANKEWFTQAHIEALVEMITIPPYVKVDDALKMLDDSDEKWADMLCSIHSDLPADGNTDIFISIFYFKTLDSILQASNDSDFSNNKLELKRGLTELQKNIEVLHNQQDVRKEIASFFAKKIKKSTSLSMENKIELLQIATKHPVFGHLNPISSVVNSASNYFTKVKWHTNTQNIFLETIDEIKKGYESEERIDGLRY